MDSAIRSTVYRTLRSRRNCASNMSHQAHPLYVLASIFLFMAFIACGISFFGPFWLGNVTYPRFGSVEDNQLYLVPNYYNPTLQIGSYSWRGLWAQCGADCKWFWENNYSLQYNKFNVLRWHLAVQVLYFIGAFLVLFCEIYARLVLCCKPRLAVYRSLGFILLASFIIQSAAIAVFGGFANRDYGAGASVDPFNTYLAWCFWMAVAGGGLTLISGILYLLLDCVGQSDDDDAKY